MLQLIEQVLDTFIENNLTIDCSKMHTFKRETEFLGLKFSENGISSADKNIHKIKQLKR